MRDYGKAMTSLRLLLSIVFPLTAAENRTLDHSAWNGILQKYVSSESRVDYRSLKEQGGTQLDRYIGQLAGPWPKGLTIAEQKAALINAYNALTMPCVLTNYPIESIWRTRHPFNAARHIVDTQKTSLDQIEGRLRDMGDPRIHAALVCAARSCPPLRREAYEASQLDGQLDANTQVWLANTSLNEFFPDRRLANVSTIFKWYRGDFERYGSPLPNFLARFGPAGKTQFLREPGVKIEYQTYHWGLNDVSSLGSRYSHWQFLRDVTIDKLF